MDQVTILDRSAWLRARVAGPTRRRRLSACVATVLAAVLLIGGCGPNAGRTADGRLKVVVTILPQVWLVRQIGGDHVEVIPLVKPGASPETYQPSDADVSRLMAAAVFFRLGVPIERGSWFEAIQGSTRLKIVDTRGDIELREIEAHVHQEEDDKGHQAGDVADSPREHPDHAHPELGDSHDELHADGKDPHVWLSPRLLKLQAAMIAATLSEIDPQHADEYAANLVTLNQRLQEVDARIREKLQPFAGRAFFVFHPAWGYFADEYGLQQVPVEVGGKAPSDRDLTELQEQARAARVRVIFVQPQNRGPAAAAVAGAIGGRVETLDPLAEDVAQGLESAAAAIAASFE